MENLQYNTDCPMSGVLPSNEVIQGQAQDCEEEEHGNGPAMPSSIHVDLEGEKNKTENSIFSYIS